MATRLSPCEFHLSDEVEVMINVPVVTLEEKIVSLDTPRVSLEMVDEKPPVERPIEEDPWALPVQQETGEPWSELTTRRKIYRIATAVAILLGLIILLYFFVVALDFLGSSLRLLAGKSAGSMLSDAKILENPLVGLMLGVLCTAIIQSSSSTSSIVISMVGAKILNVHDAIPIIMGANIGTSVTNTAVALCQANVKGQFRRSFAAATVHDMFNWLTVIVLLPIEVFTGYLEKVTELIMDSSSWEQNKGLNKAFLTVITKPFTELVVQLDKKVIDGVVINSTAYENSSVLKRCCVMEDENVVCQRCGFLIEYTDWEDQGSGFLLLVVSVVLLVVCLIYISKLLRSLMEGQISVFIKRFSNAQPRFPFNYLSGYASIMIGCCITILVQSSSVFTSALTPMAGIGVVTIESIYPLTLGSNIGTTTTGILAALAVEPSRMRYALQVAFCHLFFNITGILIFYPIAFMRFPIPLAKFLGNVTARYRWFALFYLLIMFFALPLSVFGLSYLGTTTFAVIMSIFIVVVLFIIAVNIVQRKRPSLLPQWLKTWEFLPLWLHSLDPLDRLIMKLVSVCSCCSCCRSIFGTSIDKGTKKIGMKPQNSEVNILQPALDAGGIENISFDWKPVSENTKL